MGNCFVLQNGTLPALASDVNLEEIADLCVNFSGADCHSLVDTASTECWEEMKKWRNSQQSGNEDSNPFTEGEYKLYARHFTAALKKVFPSVSDEVTNAYTTSNYIFIFIHGDLLPHLFRNKFCFGCIYTWFSVHPDLFYRV